MALDRAELEELRRYLARAVESAELLGDEPHEPIGAGRYLEPEMQDVVSRIGGDSRPITLIVGAGASMEAELPSWPALVRRLLDGVGERIIGDNALRQEWMETIEQEGLLAAAAVVKALSPSDEAFADDLRAALYLGRPSTSFVPQALAQQIAWLKQRLGSEVTIATGNYDGLLEQALRDRGLDVHSYVRWRHEPPGSAAVYHLHGRLIRGYPTTGRLVLAEDDYAAVQYPGSWQERFMRYALESTTCLFIGLSLTDPNLIRWLYRYSEEGRTTPQHYALFVRQVAPRLRPAVRRALEDAARARWERCGVEPVWADFFGESAQFLHELGLVRTSTNYVPFEQRARERFEIGQSFVVPLDATVFRQAQERASAFLSRVVERVRELAAAANVDLTAEELGLGLWGVDHAEGTVACWATADRRFNDRRALVSQPLEYASRWIAVEAVTRGVVVQEDPAVFASRWRMIRGIPVIVEDRNGINRSVVAAMTLTSMTPAASSRLARAPRGLLGAIDRFISGPVAGLFRP